MPFLNHIIGTAAAKGHVSIVQLLIEDTRVDLSRFHMRTVTSPTIIEMLLCDGRADPSMEDNAALCMACTRGDIAIVELLCNDSRVNVKCANNFPIKEAANKGHSKVCAMLLEKGVDPTADENYALAVACSKGHTEVR